MKFETWLNAPPGDVFNEKGERISGMIVGQDHIEKYFGRVSVPVEGAAVNCELDGKKYEVRSLRRAPQFLVTQVTDKSS